MYKSKTNKANELFRFYKRFCVEGIKQELIKDIKLSLKQSNIFVTKEKGDGYQ